MLIHYGSPVVTNRNTVMVPVKTGATGGFVLNLETAVDRSEPLGRPDGH